MLKRPAGHEAQAEAEARKSGPERVRPMTRPKNFFEAEATMYEAETEARHVTEQLSVYEHVDKILAFRT